MKIIQTRPSDNLMKAFIEAYLLIEGTEPTTMSTIPNGRLDMSILLEGKLEWFYPDKQTFGKLPAFTVYPLTQSKNLVRASADTRCISIKLFPHVLTLPFFKQAKFKAPQNVSDLSPAIKEKDLIASLRDTTHIEEVTVILDSFFRSHFYTEQTNLWMQQVMQFIESDNQVNIQAVADTMGVSIKTLERKFIQATGLTPKQFARIIQLHQTARKIKLSNPNRMHGEFTDLLDSSYYDQSHFIKSCKKITGLSPKQFFAQSPASMTDLIVH